MSVSTRTPERSTPVGSCPDRDSKAAELVKTEATTSSRANVSRAYQCRGCFDRRTILALPDCETNQGAPRRSQTGASFAAASFASTAGPRELDMISLSRLYISQLLRRSQGVVAW